MEEESNPCAKSNRVPTNEEIIAELTKDLEQCAVKVDPNVGDISQNNRTSSSVTEDDSSNKKKSDNFVTSDEASGSSKSCGDCEIDEEFTNETAPDDFIDEEALKDAELGYSEEEKKSKKDEAEKLKLSGNDLFKVGNYAEASRKYTLALRICPLHYSNDRAILYANRAATKIKLELKKEAVEDCTKAIELNPSYLKALLRRAQTYESLEKLDEALEDYRNVLKIEPYHKEAMAAEKRLPYEIEQRNEKLKTEMLSKLKDLGNMILRPFNLSTDNFQMNKDPNTGGYSINFTQNPR